MVSIGRIFRGCTALAVAAMLCSCGVSMQERHYFASVNKTTGETVNVYRLTVSGGAGMANARYIAGFYDERAVDLFFNEVRASNLGTTANNASAPNIFDPTCTGADAAACSNERNRRLGIVPIGDPQRTDHGSFVLILSSNADAIAGTIGQFAENDANVQAALFLATRDTHQQAAQIRAADPFVDRGRAATYVEMKALFDAVPAAPAANAANRTQAYLAILQAAAAGLDPATAPQFTNMDEAKAWFDGRPRILP